MASSERAIMAVRSIFDRYKLIAEAQDYKGFDKHLMDNAKILDATDSGVTICEFTITEQYGNLNGVMHGGAAGVIFDMCTTIALGPVAKPGSWDFLGGVTRTLNISYLKAVPLGTTVRLYSEVVQFGKTMAMIRGSMTSQDGSITYCTCEHHKVSVPTKQDHLAHKVEWDGLWKKDVDADSKPKL
ncbi:thioesterase family protein [Rutstroemia sp. NJR-2017a BVV2]|nr:thioesterase family protein [Rutstroemia sp. NJR-2017a BVV2]PQE18578.1 thioesterase family protein [Rutstroemia sp. NJR-2017a BVV2]